MRCIASSLSFFWSSLTSRWRGVLIFGCFSMLAVVAGIQWMEKSRLQRELQREAERSFLLDARLKGLQTFQETRRVNPEKVAEKHGIQRRGLEGAKTVEVLSGRVQESSDVVRQDSNQSVPGSGRLTLR